MYRKSLAGCTAAVLAATLAAATPAAAQDTPGRSPQPFDSTPVQPVAGAGSAFQDAAANWDGSAADPVGAAGSGDWTATDLSRAGSWAHGGSSGAFSYTYGMRVPPASGPVPDLALSYSSAWHDGRTSGTNNQASWVGDGWSYGPGFIERTYAGCADDDGGNQGDDPTGDLCWEDDSPSITMSLDRVNTSLVRDDDSGQWRAEEDANWRIEHMGSTASPGGTSTERWVITTTDGTRNYFASRSSSRLTVPVFGNHSGEPCYSSGDFEGSRCQQAYRWMLDKTVDVHGNVVRYTYQTAGGRYAPAVDETASASYIREAWLRRIEYGLRDGSSAPATAKVEFTVADRCLSDCRNGSGDPKEDSWPDTPWDLDCESGKDCETYSPVFFSTKRLTQIATYVANGSGGFNKVDSWKLSHEFKDYGDEEQVVLWLDSVRHTGHVGGSKSLPPVEFGGTFLPNRVDAGEAWPAIWRPRLTSIKNEAGGVTTVNYSEPDCAEGDLPAREHENSRLCYPAKYTPEGLYEPVDAYFHKYVVRSIAESDATGGGDVVWTFYDYSTSGGGTNALWAWNDAEFIEKKDRDWSQWRGYAQVTTRVGDPADPGPQQRSRTRFFRGMDGDKLPDGGKRSVSVTDSQGNTTVDHRSLEGLVWETAAYDGTTLIESESTWYRWSRTAARTYEGGKLEAFQTGPKRVDTRVKLSATAWRRTRTDTSYDQYGRITMVHEHGDTARSGDERCLRTTYTDNTEAWLLESVASVEAASVGCATTPNRPADLIGGARAYYDGHGSHAASPTRGLMTRAEALEDWDSGPVYVITGESTYDSLGRAVTATNALGETTTTAYTPAGAGPVTEVVTTNPAGHVTTIRKNPAWGARTREITPNDATTTAHYDPLGRVAGVWLPGRDPATDGPNQRFTYHISQTEPTTATTERMIQDESYLTEVVLYDSLLRQRQVQAETYGGRLISQTVYDSYGRTRFSSDPVFNNDSGPTGELVWVTRTNDVARTEFTYDHAGRVTDEAFVVKGDELWRTRYIHGGHDRHWMTTTIPPEGGTTSSTLADARGQVVELREHHDRNAGGAYDATGYDYHPNGKLEQVIDAAGNSWEFEYDLQGRRIAGHDPDAGTTSYGHNAAGQITSTVDGNGTALSYVYDVLGRPTEVREGDPDSGLLLIRRTYDGAGNGVGLPHSTIRWVDGEAWRTTVRKYSSAGEPQQIYSYLPAAAGPLAGTYWQSFTYYPDGSMLTSNAIGAGGLAREPMTYYYDEQGRPDRVTSSGDDFGEGHVYVDDAVYSPYGQLLQRTLGDPDDVGGTSGQAWQTWIYEEGTGRLAEFYFDKDTAGEFNGDNYGVAALSYEYDDTGNILAIADDPVHTSPDLDPEVQCFQYDSLRRLTEAWAQAGTGDCAVTPEPDVVGGPGRYWSSYEYDLTGNRVSETRWTPSGSDEYEYAYPDAGQENPHAVTEVSTNTGARTAFSYDQAGFTTAVDRDGAVDVLDWDTTGKLDSIETNAGTVQFFDDADGNRALRIDPNGDITAWVAGYELSYDAGVGTVEATRYYQHGGEVVGVRTGRGDIQWLASDHHDTGKWSVNGDTLTTKVRRYDPFGNERSASSTSWPDQRGFVGGVNNEAAALITLGAREYDPATGRFISRDPIADFTDPQQLNGYAYANNNPVTMSDPSGLLSIGRPDYGSAGTPQVRPSNGRRNPDSGGGRRGGGPSAGNSAGTPVAKPTGFGIGGLKISGPDGTWIYVGGFPSECEIRNCAQPGPAKLGPQGQGHEREPLQLYGEQPDIWDKVESAVAGACEWGVGGMGRPTFICDWVAEEAAPSGGGFCTGEVIGNATREDCEVYTQEDGWVSTTESGYGRGAGAGVNIGGVLTSAGSAEELEGWSNGIDISMNIPGTPITVGGGGGISDGGDWSLSANIGVGVCLLACKVSFGSKYTEVDGPTYGSRVAPKGPRTIRQGPLPLPGS